MVNSFNSNYPKDKKIGDKKKKDKQMHIFSLKSNTQFPCIRGTEYR